MAHVSQPFSRRLLQPLCPGLSLRQPRLLEACLHSLLSFLTSNFPSNPLLPDSLFSIERLSLRFKAWLAGPGDPVAVFVELEILAIVLPWPVASSCAICCCAQVPRAAHLHRRAAGIAHRPCRLKKRRLRTPGCPARGPQEAQREDSTHDAQREDFTHNTLQPSWIRPKPSSGILRGTLDTRTQTPAPRTLQL